MEILAGEAACYRLLAFILVENGIELENKSGR
jgi:hypothetical protein